MPFGSSRYMARSATYAPGGTSKPARTRCSSSGQTRLRAASEGKSRLGLRTTISVQIAPVSRTIRVPARALREFSANLARAMGTDTGAAAEVARHLVSANLSGHDSHGVLRWPQYVAELDRGELDPSAGPHSTMTATEWALAHARKSGIAAAAVRRSMHIGRLGEYTERLAAEGLVGIVTVGVAGSGSGTVAPFGGATRFLGTNPWSMGVPAEGRPPLIFDAATSTVAEGKVRLALAGKGKVPPGTVRDPEGRPTQEPAELYAGGS